MTESVFLVKNASPSQLHIALTCRPRVLDVTDVENDFALNAGKLPAPHGRTEALLPKINRFYQDVQPKAFDIVLIKQDTHFKGEYFLSPEAKDFPNIHCEWNTPGWQLSVNADVLKNKSNVFYMMKNNLDMFNTIPTGVAKEKIVFTSSEEEAAYDNLFKVTPDLSIPGTPRDQWLDENKIGEGTPIVVHGLFDDFCNKYSWEGYLRRGCTLIVMTDLSEGIFKRVEDLIAEDVPFEKGTVEKSDGEKAGIQSWRQAYQQNKVLLTTSDDVLHWMDHIIALEESGLAKPHTLAL